MSLGISLVHIASTFASVAYDSDTNVILRTCEPLYFGFIPDGPRANLCVAALSLFGLLFLASKLIATAALGGASPVGLLLFCAAECTGLILVRMALKNWRQRRKVNKLHPRRVVQHGTMLVRR